MRATVKQMRLRIELALTEPEAGNPPVRRPRAPLTPSTGRAQARSRPVLSAPEPTSSDLLVSPRGTNR